MTVVWNPWEENAKKMADFGDDEVISHLMNIWESIVVKLVQVY